MKSITTQSNQPNVTNNDNAIHCIDIWDRPNDQGTLTCLILTLVKIYVPPTDLRSDIPHPTLHHYPQPTHHTLTPHTTPWSKPRHVDNVTVWCGCIPCHWNVPADLHVSNMIFIHMWSWLQNTYFHMQLRSVSLCVVAHYILPVDSNTQIANNRQEFLVLNLYTKLKSLMPPPPTHTQNISYAHVKLHLSISSLNIGCLI